ncbi:unnamed protein product [Camellia sinensis]
MALQHTIGFRHFFSHPLKDQNFKDSPYSSFAATTTSQFKEKRWKTGVFSSRMDNSTSSMSSPNFPKSPSRAGGFRLRKLRASRIAERLKPDDDEGNKDREASSGSDGEDDAPLLMDEEERQEWRRKIREVIDMNLDVKEEVDPIERRKKMQNLLANYPLVVEEDDPDWPEDHMELSATITTNAVVELDLVSALQVSIFPELIFTKAGKILYREKAIRTADELSKIMAFFYYGAAKPRSLNTIGKSEEPIPTISINSEQCQNKSCT